MLEHITLCAKAGHGLSRSEAHLSDKVCEVAKEVCRQSTARLVASCRHEPCLQSCACDGTPIQVSLQMQQHLPSGRLITRGGKASYEFLVASQFTRWVDAAGEAKTSFVARDPLPLTNGKATAQLVEAATSQWQSLRQHGHLGPIIQHYCWDRLGWAAQRRRMLQLHHLLMDQWGGGENEPSSGLLWLLQWNAFTACALHDAQNAFRWSLKELFDDADLLKSVYIGVASIRNSTDTLLTYVGEWVSLNLQYVDPHDPTESEHWRTVWASLGLKSDIVHLLVDELGLRWVRGERPFLAVVKAASEGGVVSAICAALVSIWNIPKYSDSRWLTISIAAKGMVASHLTGLTDFIKYISTKPSVSNYYLGGFVRMEAQHWQFLVQAALVGAIPQAAQLALLEDSRVAMTAPSIKGAIACEIQHLVALPDPVWAILSEVGGFSMRELRSKCFVAVHRACAFFQFRVLDEADELPWSLCRGDVKANLLHLSSQPKPSHPEIAVKAWDLMKMGYPLHRLCRMVLLLGDAPWSTAVVEQLHGSAAVISRQHPEYGLNTLLTRSMALLASKLLPGPSPEEKKVAKLKAQLDKLERKNPDRTSGRHLFFQDLANLATDKFAGDTPVKLAQVQRTIMKQHGKSWRSAKDHHTVPYKARAKAEAAKQKCELAERRKETAMALQAAQAEASIAAKKRPPLTLASAMWGQFETDLFEKLMSDGCYSRPNMHRMRDKACVAPPRISPVLQGALDDQDCIEEHRPLPELPPWLVTLAKHREDMEGCAFLFSLDGHSRAFLFVFAMLRPTFVSLSELKPLDVFVPTKATGFHDTTWPRTDFQVDFQSNVNGAVLAHVPMDQMSILEGLVHMGSCTVSSRLTPVPLNRFLERLERTQNDRSASDEMGDAPKKVKKLEPWAEKLLEKQYSKTAGSSQDHVPVLPVFNDSEFDIDEDLAWETDPKCQSVLQEYRNTLHDPGQRTDDFGVSVLSGQWQLQHKGMFVDAFKASAKGEESIEWCRSRGLHVSARYELSLYGDATAAVLARAWAAKMQYMFNLCMANHDPLLAITDELIQAWPEPSEFSTLSVGCQSDQSRRLSNRIRQIRDLR
jgi:hypothetical protein